MRDGKRREIVDPLPRRPAQVEPDVQGDLVVAGPAGVELAGRRPDQLVEAAFDGAVDVLVGFEELELPLIRFDPYLLQPGRDSVDIGLLQDADLAEHRNVSQRALDIVGQQPAI